MSGEQHLADARRRAEEALRRVLANAAAIVRLSWSDGATPSDRANLERIKSAAADIAQDHKILRALLAAGPEAGAPGHDRIAELESLLRECNAVCLCGCPESEHESYGEDGESCADEGHECIRVAPAVLEIVQRYRVALAGTPAPRPAQDAVREAAERADKAMRDVFGGVDQFGDYCGHPVMPGKLAYAVQALLAALPWEPAPGVREAFVAGGGAVVSGEAPGGEGKTCPGCGGLGWIPAGDEQAGCIDCNGTGHAPAPPSTATEPGAGEREEKLPPFEKSWMDSARQYAKNEAYYRGLIEAALKDIPAAYLCDDGTRSEDVLCAKLPEIVHALAAQPPRPAQDAVREAAERHRVEADHRCCLDLLRSARLYFADGHPMRLAIERTLAERPAPSSARAAKGGE